MFNKSSAIYVTISVEKVVDALVHEQNTITSIDTFCKIKKEVDWNQDRKGTEKDINIDIIADCKALIF